MVGLVVRLLKAPSMLAVRMGVSAPVPHGVGGVSVESARVGAYMPKRVEEVRLRIERERETFGLVSASLGSRRSGFVEDGWVG
jgi:hypothetical protein